MQDKVTATKERPKKEQKRPKMEKVWATTARASPAPPATAPLPAPAPARTPLPNPATTASLARLRGRLAGGAFRWLNESLYTTDGDGAWGLMAGAPDLFEQYHQA